MRNLLIVLLAYSICLVQNGLADLPSCIRAKCSHCKVPFIAQMCPIACSGCSINQAQNFLTAGKPARNSAEHILPHRAYAQSRVKVPFAQQIPNLESNRNRVVNFESQQQKPVSYHQNQQQQFHQSPPNHAQQQFQQPSPAKQQFQPNHLPQQFNARGWERNGELGQQQQFAQQIPNQNNFANQLQFQQPQQYEQQQPAFPPSQIQQTTNFGGSYSEQPSPALQTQIGQQPPPFFNPYQQPFLPQPLQQAQQIPPAPMAGGRFTPPNIPQQQLQFPSNLPQQSNAGGIGGAQTNQFIGQVGQQIPQNAQFPVLNPQMSQNIIPPPPAQPQQQLLIQQPIDGQLQQQQFPQNGNAPFRPNGGLNPSPPILHAVPNVVDPLQRPRQLHNNIPSLQPINEPHHQGKYINEKVIYDKGSVINEIKKPANFITDAEQKCPRPNWEPCLQKDIANQRFQNCCSRLGEGCSQLCSYDQNLTTIQLAVLTGRCPVNKVADMMLCASGYEDATACCQAFGVFEPGFEHCRPYCNPAGGLPNDGMLAEKYRCLQKLAQIQKCFYLTQRP